MEPTTLILGAGTSISYGYPSGHELIERIIDLVNSQEHPHSFVKKFSQDLWTSKIESIDSFLNYRQEYAELGKKLITEVILKAEDEYKLMNCPADQDLYRYILNEVSIDNFVKLKIISFNYDRSFQEYMYKALSARYGKNHDETWDLVQKIDIIHMHGRMPALEGESLKTKSSLEIKYGLYNDEDHRSSAVLETFARNIATVHEKHEQETLAAKFIGASERVIFLGFGYHDLNMKKLEYDFKNNTNRKIVYGTTHGIADTRVSKLQQDYKDIRFRNMNAMTFFKKVVSLS